MTDRNDHDDAIIAAMRSAIVIVALFACHHDDYQVYTPPLPPDAAVSCGLVTCATLNATCGPIGDGCGNQFDCGTCTAPDDCGAAGTPYTCGASPCVPRTCAEAGGLCGKVADGCGGLTESCGDCMAPQTCGGGGVANACGSPPCTGLCLQQSACGTTTITGVVTAPGHDDTVTWEHAGSDLRRLGVRPERRGRRAHVRRHRLHAGASPGARQCSGLASGSPLVIATTGVDGTFTLANAPCGTNIPLVIQLGRWRREITIPSVACVARTRR